jgi:hypothetical protein
MRKLLLTLNIVFIITGSFAQSIDALTASKFITAAGLKKHLSIIASAAMEGREAGTAGERKAAAYLESQYRNLKFTPGNNGNYKMPFKLYKSKIENSDLSINGNPMVLNQDYWISPAMAPSAPYHNSTILYVGDDFNDKSTLDVKGKLLVALEGKDRTIVTIAAARKLGAAGIIVIAKQNPKNASDMESRLSLNKGNANFIGMTISKAIASPLVGGSKPYSESDWTEVPKGVYNVTIDWKVNANSLEVPSANVIAYIPSNQKSDEYVFITSHYDHEGIKNGEIYYGADDDGSGTTGVLALAEAFYNAIRKGFSPKRNIVFMNVSGEEKGLLGSEYYSDHPIFPLDKTSVDINIDMIGRIDPTYKGDSTNYLYLIGEDKLSSDLLPITNQVNKSVHLELDRRFNDPSDPNRFYYRSDHYNFAKKGVPVIFYFNGTHADYHKPTDRVEKINFDLMEKRAQLIFMTAWEMIQKEEMLKRDLPLNMPGR